MKFSSLFLILILTLWLCIACHNSRYAVITGVIKNYNDNPIWLHDDKISYEPDTIKVVNDSFYKKIQITSPVFKVVVIGRYSRMIFLKPGYLVKIYGDGDDIETTIRIEGKGARENAIQDSINNNVLYSVNYRHIFSQPAEPALNYLDSLVRAVNDYSAKLTNNVALDKEYVEYLSLFLKYYFANLRMIIGLRNGIKEDSFYNFVSSILIEDEKLLDVPDYRDFLRHYVLLKESQAESVADSLEGKSTTNYLDRRISIIANFKNRAIKEYMLYKMLYDLLQEQRVKDFDKYYGYFKRTNKNKVYASQLEKIYLKKKLLEPGNNAPDFTCYDFNNNQVSLSNFRGKYVYIDFWATWCKPCRDEIPYYLKLQKEYKDKDIVFLSICLDDDKESWQEFIKDIKNEGKWLYATDGFNSEVVRSYQIIAIPRFCLIDKEGKILTTFAPRPSSDEIRKLLDSLLSIK